MAGLARFVALIGVLSFTPGAARAAAPENAQCPVMPDRTAGPEFRTQYRGRTVRFCCGECAAKFEANPNPYLANLPAGYFDPPNEPVASNTIEKHPAIAIVIAAVLLLKVGAFAVRRRSTNPPVASPGNTRERVARRNGRSRATHSSRHAGGFS